MKNQRCDRHALFVAILIALSGLAACAAQPRTAPYRMGPVETGPTTIEAARQYLQGRWTLLSYDVFPPGREAIRLSGSGTLSYDAFGNLDMQIRVDDPATSDALVRAGVPLTDSVIASTGRTVINMQERSLIYMLEGQKPLLTTAETGPLAPTRKRYWQVEGNVLTLTTRDDDGKPLSVGRWQKQP